MLIYAHRGASYKYPELTAAAYEAAVAEGADGFECDLRLSRDEVPVLWHNASMLEQAGNTGLIAEMTFTEISRAYPEVLTLDSFLDIALKYKKPLLIETKHPVISGNRVEEILVKTLRERQVQKSIGVSVMSFSWSAVEKMHRIAPEIPTTLLLSNRLRFLQARFSSATMIAPGIELLRSDPLLIKKIENLGKSTAVWTVDEASDVELAGNLGVDILITNMPARARSFL